MDFERALEIVIKARDEASKTLRGVGHETDSLADKFKKNYKEAGLMAGAVIGGLALMTKAAVENAAAYEQNRIAFETMLGTADKARALLKQVSDFAQKTPFELPQVVEGTKRLLAYGIAQKDIIPTFRQLGDIAAGVGVDKMPQLITAFGQVKAASKLTGMELRQFSETGVPLLDALVKQANKGGGALVTVTKGATMTAAATAKMNSQLAISRQRLKEATEGGKAKQSTLMSLNAKIGEYEGKLASASGGQQSFTKRVQVTKAEMLDMISEGKVSFEQVQQAISGMSEKGGLFFQGMERQAKTFNGVMSNINDAFGRFIRQVAGISEEGDIREGSIFYYFKLGAERLLPVIEELGPKVAAFIEMAMQNKELMIGLAGAIGGLLVLALVALIATFGTAIVIMAAFAAAGAVVALKLHELWVWFNEIKGPISEFFVILRDSWNDVVAAWTAKIAEIENTFRGAWNRLPKIVQDVLGMITKMIANFNPIIRIGLELPNIVGAFNNLRESARKNGIPGFAQGTDYAPGGLAVVGERGPELVNLPRGSQVFSNQESRGMMGGPAIQINQVVIRQDSDIETLARRLEFYRKTGGAR